MSYQLVAELSEKAVTVATLCRVLGVSRSGYYGSRQRAQAAPKVCATGVQLKAEFAASGRVYGSRRLGAVLRSKGLRIGRYRVRRMMREHRLRALWRRKFIHTTDSGHALPVSDNVLARRFNPSRPNQAWVSDITLYLVVVANSFRHPRRGQHGYHARLRAWDVDVAPRLTFAPFGDRTVAKASPGAMSLH